jgi:hypothetical protein
MQVFVYIRMYDKYLASLGFWPLPSLIQLGFRPIQGFCKFLVLAKLGFWNDLGVGQIRVTPNRGLAYLGFFPAESFGQFRVSVNLGFRPN